MMMIVAMRKLKIFAVAALLVASSVFAPAAAQEYGRLLHVQYVDQFYNGRIDGRPHHNEGLPPSAADEGNRIYDNPIGPQDCREVEMLAPDARRGWQARVRAACDE
jgi:hypothetical protein